MPEPASPAPHAPTPIWWRLALAGGVIAVAAAAWSFQETIAPRGQAFLGMCCALAAVAALSANLRAVNWRTIGCGFVLQWLLALFILKLELRGLEAIGIEGSFRPGYELFATVASGVNKFLDFPAAGMSLLFGRLVDEETMTRLFGPGNHVIFAFGVLPAIIFVSSFFTVLYYLGVLQWIVRICARAMIYFMGTSGAETLSSIANVFMGQTEAPLVVKPYVPKMTQSELLAMMVGGMATISGGLMATYIKIGADPVAILATSVMAAPCGLYLSKLLLPEIEEPETRGLIKTDSEMPYRNVIDAAAAGATDGLYLVLNVAAMLIAFMGIIAMINYLLGCIPTQQGGPEALSLFAPANGWYAVGNALVLLLCYLPLWLAFRTLRARWSANASVGWQDAIWFVIGLSVFACLALAVMIYVPAPLSLNWIFSQFFAPVALLIGVDGADIYSVADLLGTKLALNEFVAYIDLTTRYRTPIISERSYKIATYALTGFANFASVGIQIGGIGAIAPGRRSDLARLGMRALFVGFMATVLNAAIAGILLDE